ncbi:MAG: MotA/TolQ/ExbB proton channel family protein [Sulfuricaulis sp.]|uniref:MotA/TolQ/ExbB proton channel family protein n=1 Tax=Sulfuricaulis sp. TaxID=2003553 RepID=UPI0034A29FD4
MPATNHPNYFGLQAFLGQLDPIGTGVALVLLGMSLIAWYLIFAKAWRIWQARRRRDGIIVRFWDAPNLKEAAQFLRDHRAAEPAARLAFGAIQAAEHRQQHRSRAERLGDQTSLSDLVVRTLRQTLVRENLRLESGLSVLASIGAVAPFVGLFGTVWGVYHALLGIGTGGIATLDKVAGPVGEALIMTAAGLAVAIPAVLAYNAFTRANRVIVAELDGFAHDLHTWLTSGTRLDGQAAPAVPLKPALKGVPA